MPLGKFDGISDTNFGKIFNVPSANIDKVDGVVLSSFILWAGSKTVGDVKIGGALLLDETEANTLAYGALTTGAKILCNPLVGSDIMEIGTYYLQSDLTNWLDWLKLQTGVVVGHSYGYGETGYIDLNGTHIFKILIDSYGVTPFYTANTVLRATFTGTVSSPSVSVTFENTHSEYDERALAVNYYRWFNGNWQFINQNQYMHPRFTMKFTNNLTGTPNNMELSGSTINQVALHTAIASDPTKATNPTNVVTTIVESIPPGAMTGDDVQGYAVPM